MSHSDSTLMYAWLIPLFPLIGALINLTIGRRHLPKWLVTTIAVGAVAASFAVAAYAVFGPLFDEFQGEYIPAYAARLAELVNG